MSGGGEMATVENKTIFLCLNGRKEVMAGGGYRVTGAYYLFFFFF